MIEFRQASDVKRGDYLMIKGHACKCAEVTLSKTGKHGGCKCHFTGIDIFDDSKHLMIASSTDNIEVPVVAREEFQLCDILDDGYLSLANSKMELRNDISVTDRELLDDLRNKFDNGDEIYITIVFAVGKNKIASHKSK